MNKSKLPLPSSGPDHLHYKAILELDESELARRRALLELGDDDLARLAELRPFAERHTDAVVDEFYQLLLALPESKAFLNDNALVTRLKGTQRAYFLGLFTGRCDLDYVEDRLRVGVAHEKIGIRPKIYLGAYRRYLHLLLKYLSVDFADADFVHQAFASIQKMVYFDMSIAIDTYFAAHLETITRQQAAIRELSTPVTQVHDRVLLLPLVGEIDQPRATQVMDRVLAAVAAESALVVIIDIAGVPVVDTRVANHLLKTTAAARYLGARTILSGISPSVSQSMVALGVDLSSMVTVGRLKDGIDLAFKMLGRERPSA
ncbi:protoglobin domain-containing protein [Labilithrix luteola]|nr:protoglobin domain-containing protein [Labilithrix luteola]